MSGTIYLQIVLIILADENFLCNISLHSTVLIGMYNNEKNEQ